jgi:DNA-binding transcriptional MerR regulator
VDKEPGAFRTISEVAEDLDLPQHVLRFWETRFSQIKPLKRGGGRRYYRPDDVELLRGIRHLLYGEGYTIRGVQRILKEEGPRFVQTVWRGAEADPAAEHAGALPPGPRVATPAAEDEPRSRPEPAPARPVASPPPMPSSPPRPAAEPAIGGRPGLLGLLPKLGRESEPPALPRVVEVPIPSRKEPPLFREPPAGADAEEAEADRSPYARPREPVAAPEPVVRAPAEVQPPAALHAVEPVRPEPVLRAAPPEAAARRLSHDDVRRLQAALRELHDCRRILDAALAAGRDG